MKPVKAEDDNSPGVRRSPRVASDLEASKVKSKAEPVRISARNERRRMTPLTVLSQKYSQLIGVMIKEFNILEADLRTIPNPNQTQQQIDSAVQRHTKLVLFLKHLKQAGDLLNSGGQRSGKDAAGEEQEARDLEKRIKEKFIPVYNRLVKQREDSKKASKAPPPGHVLPRPANIVQAEPSATAIPPTANVAAAPADAPSIFNKPLKGGSFLTQKLHGSRLGSSDRRHGSGVGSTTPVRSNNGPRILRAGMAPGSDNVIMPPPSIGGGPPTHTKNPAPIAFSPAATANISSANRPMSNNHNIHSNSSNNNNDNLSNQSSYIPNHVPAPAPPTPQFPPSAASSDPPKIEVEGAVVGAPSAGFAAANHPSNFHDHDNLKGGNESEPPEHDTTDESDSDMNTASMSNSPELNPTAHNHNSKLNPLASPINPINPAFTFSSPSAAKKDNEKSSNSLEEINNWVETDILRPHFSQVQQVGKHLISVDNIPPNPLAKKPKKKRKKEPRYSGPSTATPKAVDYTCAECNEIYPGQATANPWWLVSRQQCPKCMKDQIPRIDINAPNNLIDYHPALLAHELEDSEEGHSHLLPTPNLTTTTDENGGMALLTSTQEEESSSSESEGEEDPGEDFSEKGYKGPRMTKSEAARMVVLLNHARNCPGNHKSDKHREVCQSSKFMLLHVRDCTGSTSFGDPCPYPWCRKVKHLLFHLLSCEKPEECEICSGGSHLSRNMVRLKQINEINLSLEMKRMKLKREEEEKATSMDTGEIGGEGGGGGGGGGTTNVGLDQTQQDIIALGPGPRNVKQSHMLRVNSSNSLAVTPPTSASPVTLSGEELVSSTTNSESTANSNGDESPNSNNSNNSGGDGGAEGEKTTSSTNKKKLETAMSKRAGYTQL
ncbi:hypothetical protein TrVE_jg10569 [Triparma verrucosa]|uniref:TAZ-type domain-containing protein n=1 Tax=Triparma verrucosa TaxID=1606542 RepID=A0A9W7FG59_9STRA|nr:hypothetical protein TrVE_jg10569 [Triparma verrucosa]